MNSLKFISSNPHKFKEITAAMNKHNIQVSHLKQEYSELQADSTKEIAIASAASLSPVIDSDFFLEDSGLRIESLEGFPGPYSSYIYRTIGWEGVLKLLRDKENRNASFISVFALVQDNNLFTFEGICPGKISLQGRGEQGFGFDPIFIPKEKEIENSENLTFAQLSADHKNKISHRARALAKLIDFLIR